MALGFYTMQGQNIYMNTLLFSSEARFVCLVEIIDWDRFLSDQTSCPIVLLHGGLLTGQC